MHIKITYLLTAPEPARGMFSTWTDSANSLPSLFFLHLPSALWHCWLQVRKSIRPAR